MEVPASLKANKAIAPYIARSVELESINPVISYYCKLYVLEFILSSKLHATDKDIETYTIGLLDETEAIKGTQDPENEGLYKVLNDKNISLSVVMEFSYNIFNNCLQELNQYDGTTRLQLISKFRACLNFLNLLSIFYNKPDESINWEKYSGGKAKTNEEFAALNKEKLKIIKYHLSQLIKDQVPIKSASDDKELEDELEKELKKIEIEGQQDGGLEHNEQPDFEPEQPFLPSAPKDIHDEGKELKDFGNGLGLNSTTQGDNSEVPFLPSAPKDDQPSLPSAPKDDDVFLPSAPKDNDTFLPSAPRDDEPFLPSAPKFIDDDGDDDDNDNGSYLDKDLDVGSHGISQDNGLSLPGAPHYSPSDDSVNDEVRLPGAPKFLPDDDISHINKDSSIKVFTPSSDAPPKKTKRVSSISKNVESTYAKPSDINEIIDTTEAITKIQKHAKFAISALNYEDMATAEKELVEGLELLRRLRK